MQSISPVATLHLTSRAMVSLHPLQVFVFKPTCTILSTWYLGENGSFQIFYCFVYFLPCTPGVCIPMHTIIYYTCTLSFVLLLLHHSHLLINLFLSNRFSLKAASNMHSNLKQAGLCFSLWFQKQPLNLAKR